MACHHPLRAWRTKSGTISLGRELPDADSLRLPCGGCLGCRMAKAKEWALRCHLELVDHDHAAFTTLTYSDEHLPPTLRKRHLQLFLKRLRRSKPARRIRFFAAGEYGEQNQRPHYHAILYGIGHAPRDHLYIEDAWGQGYCHTVAATPANIAYTAGYTAKKTGWARDAAERDIVDAETGEVLPEKWQPPFIQMSRNPGIGATAKQHINSWREYAIHNGTAQPVPHYLHTAWKNQATQQQKEELEYQKHKKTLTRDNTTRHLQAQEKIAIKKQEITAARRKL